MERRATRTPTLSGSRPDALCHNTEGAEVVRLGGLYFPINKGSSLYGKPGIAGDRWTACLNHGARRRRPVRLVITENFRGFGTDLQFWLV